MDVGEQIEGRHVIRSSFSQASKFVARHTFTSYQLVGCFGVRPHSYKVSSAYTTALFQSDPLRC